MAKGAAPLWKVDPDEVYEMGGFLFDAERALFAGFRDSEIRIGGIGDCAEPVEKGSMSREQFLSDADTLISSSAWNELRSLDLTFSGDRSR